jgi:hypothetical protein
MNIVGSSRTQQGLHEHSMVFKNTAGSSRTQQGLQEHSRVFKNTAGSSRRSINHTLK